MRNAAHVRLPSSDHRLRASSITAADSRIDFVMSAPVVNELSPAPDVADALAAVSSLPAPILFESARRHPTLGRYSFLTANPMQFFEITCPEFGVDPFVEIRRTLGEFEIPPVPGLPPFQGGAAGLLGYELGRCWERLPEPESDDLAIPVLAVGIYDWVLTWDHVENRAWLISHGIEVPASQRIDDLCHRLGDSAASSDLAESAPAESSGALRGFTSNFSRAQYLDAVAAVIGAIRAGEIFQANLAQQLTRTDSRSPVELYAALRRANPAPFAGLLARDDWAVISSSPERFLRVEHGTVETRPIKGTRRRSARPEADLFIRDELRESAKDQAENVMIVDLLRNDLSRVCRPGSIRVPQLCGVETYETVQHLVSEVRGELRPGCDFWDVMAAAFPGGSITGAPKVRAMEIITQLERIARGPYCGSLFYCGFDGTADSSILIRTLVQRGGRVQCGVGGGVIAQSDPIAEYEETLHKAAGMLAAFPETTTAIATSGINGDSADR